MIKIKMTVMVLGFFIFIMMNRGYSYAYDSHDKRDPFWPLVSPSGTIISYDQNLSVADLVLEGTISDQEGHLAIINGNIVKKGDTVGAYTVKRVLTNQVILVEDGEVFHLIMDAEE